jgi:hypothetical protein
MAEVPQIYLCFLAMNQGHELASHNDAAFSLHGISWSGSEQGELLRVALCAAHAQ